MVSDVYKTFSLGVGVFSLFLKGLLGFRGVLYFFKLNSYKVNLGPSQALQLAYRGIYL